MYNVDVDWCGICIPVLTVGNIQVFFWCSCFSLQDNKLDFMEYIAALHLVLRGRLEDRLKWSFKMYDTDGNGRLDRQEIKHIIKVRE